ncbi:MAG: 50S ribosomal protein L29 [Flavobacteriales bacterium]|nr:50S ribosomal protein L29 [Flavobacteriales bacterium]MCB9447071.1 50S ribosomal protein L29 [Flavobacteriales bacterium]
MKQAVIKELALSDLKDKIEEQEDLLSKLVMNHAVATIENPMKIRYTRRTIARLKTELNKRTQAAAETADKK